MLAAFAGEDGLVLKRNGSSITGVLRTDFLYRPKGKGGGRRKKTNERASGDGGAGRTLRQTIGSS